MKIVSFLVVLLLAVHASAGSREAGIQILNPTFIERVNDEEIHHFYQGETIAVLLEADFPVPGDFRIKTFNPKDSLRRFGEGGLIFVGISMLTEPGEYPVCLGNNCDDNDRKNQLRVKINRADFEKTRTAASSRQPAVRRDRQKSAIDKAFGANISSEDLTLGQKYIDPMNKPRDIIDPFGLIYANNHYLPHSGVDLRLMVGEPIRAVNRGRVVLVAKRYRREGNMVIISHGSGIFSVYMHLSRFGEVESSQKSGKGKTIVKKRQLRAGDMVERGQVIGLSGATGAGVREPHLHFNIRVGEVYVEPLRFIDMANKYLQ